MLKDKKSRYLSLTQSHLTILHERVVSLPEKEKEVFQEGIRGALRCIVRARLEDSPDSEEILSDVYYWEVLVDHPAAIAWGQKVLFDGVWGRFPSPSLAEAEVLTCLSRKYGMSYPVRPTAAPPRL